MSIIKLKKFWTNKRVLIIGHTGFTGSWLTIFLNYLGASISGYSLNNDKKYVVFNKLSLKSLLINNCFADINNEKIFSKFIKKVKPQIVINLAAQALVRKSYFEPLETYKTNLMGALNVLYLSKNIHSIRAILMITTDKVYFNSGKKTGYKETDRLGGFDPYSSSKAASEIAIESFDKSFFNNNSKSFIATARAGNIIGGGDWSEDRLIPDLMKSFLYNKSLVIRNLNSIRPWQHVLEAVYGYSSLCQKLYKKKIYAKGPWNFGPNKNNFLTVRQIINKIKKYINFKIKLKIKKSSLHEAKILKLNNSKAKNFLNWKPLLSVEEMIGFTCNWYLALNKNKKYLYNLTISQIEKFIKKI